MSSYIDPYEHTVSGLLRKRHELESEAASLREQLGQIATDLEAISRVLGSFGYQSNANPLKLTAARITMFYSNELRQSIQAELAKAAQPMTSRQLAQALCQTEGRN